MIEKQNQTPQITESEQKRKARTLALRQQKMNAGKKDQQRRTRRVEDALEGSMSRYVSEAPFPSSRVGQVCRGLHAQRVLREKEGKTRRGVREREGGLHLVFHEREERVSRKRERGKGFSQREERFSFDSHCSIFLMRRDIVRSRGNESIGHGFFFDQGEFLTSLN